MNIETDHGINFADIGFDDALDSISAIAGLVEQTSAEPA